MHIESKKGTFLAPVRSISMLAFALVFILINMPNLGATQVVPDKPYRLFFAGMYFDPIPAKDRLAVYLLSSFAAFLQGTELTPFGKEALAGNSDLKNVITFVDEQVDASRPRPDAAALYVSRADHEEILLEMPGLPAKFITNVYVSISFDVFSDQAKDKNLLQFETLYSKILVGQRSISSDHRINPETLRIHYQKCLRETLSSLLRHVADDFRVDRHRSDATFQLIGLKLRNDPGMLQEMQPVLATDGTPGQIMLRLEWLHMVNQFVSDELRGRGVNNVALLSPPSVWSHSQVGYLLAARLRNVDADSLRGREIRFFVDPRREPVSLDPGGRSPSVTGYEVELALVRAETKTHGTNRYQEMRIFGTQLLARIYRPVKHGGQEPPAAGNGARAPVKGLGQAVYETVAGMTRGTTRFIAYSALEKAGKDVAPGIVDRMQEIAANP